MHGDEAEPSLRRAVQREKASKIENPRFQIETLALNASQNPLQSLQTVDDIAKTDFWKQGCEESSRYGGEQVKNEARAWGAF